MQQLYKQAAHQIQVTDTDNENEASAFKDV